MTCEGPDPLKGQPLVGMTRDDFHCSKFRAQYTLRSIEMFHVKSFLWMRFEP